MKRKEISSAGSSQSPAKKRRVDDESSSAPNDGFTTLMKDDGIKIRGNKWHLTGSTAAMKRALEKKFVADDDARKDLFKAFLDHVSYDANLKRCLMPLIASANEDSAYLAVGAVGQESVVKLFLGVPSVQTQLIDFLLEKIPDYMTDSDAMAIEDNIPRLILSQFRWLDLIVDSEGLAKKLVETLAVCTPQLKKEIVSFIPEIIDDYGHQLIIEELRNMLEDTDLTVSVVDALSNLSLKPELLDKVRGGVIHMLNSSRIEDLPVLLKFILQSASTDADKVAKEIRECLDVETLNTSANSKESEALTFETLKTGIRYNKELPKAFLKILATVPPGGYRVLDMWLVYILLSVSSCRSKLEPAVRKQIAAGNIGEVLFRKSITGHTHALKTLFPEILSLASMLLRSGTLDPQLPSFGSLMYKRLFVEFAEPYFQQEILLSIIAHVGSSNNVEVMAALTTISNIVNAHHAMAKNYAPIIQGLLDYFDLAPVSSILHVRKIYRIFCDLYFGDALDPLPTSDLDILLKKQLSNPDIKYKKMGIVGAAALICTLALRSRRVTQENKGVSAEADEIHVQDVHKSLEKTRDNYDLQEFFNDEMCQALSTYDVVDNVLQELSGNLEEDLFHSFFIENNESDVAVVSFAQEGRSTVMVNIYGFVHSKGPEKVQLSSKVAAFKLLLLINAKLDPTLSPIDALCLCPFLVSKEHDEDEFKTLTGTEKEDLCVELFHTLNCMREIINTFSLHGDHKIQANVVNRLEQAINVERRLDMYFGLTPTFVLNTKTKVKAKVKSPGKGEKANGESGASDITKIELDFTPTLSVLRPFALTTCLVLNYTEPDTDEQYKLLKMPARTIYHTVKDLDTKLDYLMSYPKRILNPTVANAPPPVWSTVYQSKIEAIELIKPVFATLCQRLKDLAVPDEEEANDPFISPAIETILECLKRLFSCPIFYSTHQKLFAEILIMILNVSNDLNPLTPPAKKMTLPTMLVQCFEYFSKFEPIISEFNSSKALLDLLASIVAELEPSTKRNDLSVKLSDHAGRLLFTRDWPGHLKVKSDAVSHILEINVRYTGNALTTLTNITKELGVKSESPLRTALTHIYFKVVIAEIAKILSENKFKKKKEDEDSAVSGKNTLEYIGKVYHVFKDLNDLTSMSEFQSPNVLMHFMKYGRKICDTVVQAIPWMSDHFKEYRDEIIATIKVVQACTRKLQWYCENKKAAKDLKLLNYVPPLKKSLEAFVLKIKKMFQSNGILTALWFGNLKHKTLSGEVVDSQIVKEEKDASNDSDNEAKSAAPSEEEEQSEQENSASDAGASKKKKKHKKNKDKKDKKAKKKKEKSSKKKKKSKKKDIIEEEKSGEEEERAASDQEEQAGSDEPMQDDAERSADAEDEEAAASDQEVDELSVNNSDEDEGNGPELNSDEV